MEPFLPTFPVFLCCLLDKEATVVPYDPYPCQGSLQVRSLLCLTFCSHVASALPHFHSNLFYSAPMLISLEVNQSGVCKFIWFLQGCKQANEHSVIPDGAACQMGEAATDAAY